MKPPLLSRLARRDIVSAAEFHEKQKPGLGAEFTDRIEEALERIRLAPKGYQIIHGDVRRVTLRQFKDWALWYRVLPDHSIVVACLNNRMNPRIVKEKAMGVRSIRDPKP